MIVNGIKYLVGSVRFRLSGEFPERFLNQLAAHRIPFWDIGRDADGFLLTVRLKDYKKLRKVKGKNRIKTRVIERKGLPFILKKYRLRIGFFAGLVFFFVSLWFLSGFIWNVNVIGNSSLSETDVIAALNELGLYEGCRISSLDSKALRTDLALKLDNIAWAAVNIEGTTATVNISESLDTEISDNSPCNLLASTDGVIKRLEVTEGTIVSAVGQTVKAGDMLVSGVTEYKNGNVSFGPSTGKVYAETTKTLSFLATFVQTEKIYIGEPESKSVLTFFGMDIPLYLGSLKGNFETETEVKRFGTKGCYIPLKITETTFKRVDVRAFEIGEAVATELAENKLSEMERTELEGKEILSKTVKTEVTQKGVRITAEYRLLENIAERDLLLIYNEK